jgi:competence ComEA-like helix-hairpin-helix protein
MRPSRLKLPFVALFLTVIPCVWAAAPLPVTRPVVAEPVPVKSKLSTSELKPVFAQPTDADAVTSAPIAVKKEEAATSVSVTVKNEDKVTSPSVMTKSTDGPSTGTLAWPNTTWEPTPSPTPVPTATPKHTPSLPPPVSTRPPQPALNLNTATEEQLAVLPGLDRVRAKLIVAHRQAIGQFTRVDQLLQVSGISETIFNRVQSHVTLGQVPTAAPAPTAGATPLLPPDIK